MKNLMFAAALAFSFAASAAVVVPFSPKNGGVYSVGSGGKLTRVEAFSPVSGGTVALKSIYSAPTYTNAVEVKVATNFEYSVVESNAYTHAVSTNLFNNLSWVDDPGILGVSTNRLIVASTNSWPLVSGSVCVTNDLISGTATGYVYGGSLQDAKFLAPGERIIFTGTAVGGWVRMIFE